MTFLASFGIYAFSCYRFATCVRLRRDISGLLLLTVATGISALVNFIKLCFAIELFSRYRFLPPGLVRMLFVACDVGDWSSLIIGLIGIMALTKYLGSQGGK